MFPQLMMLFIAAGDDRSLKQTMILDQIVVGFLFIFLVLIGVWGHVSFPGVEGRAADQILPMMLEANSP